MAEESERGGGWLVGGGVTAALLVTLITLGAARNGSSERKTRPQTQHPESLLDADSSRGLVREGPLKPVWEFLDLRPPALPPQGKRYEPTLLPRVGVFERETRSEELLCDWPQPECLADCSFRFLIATVPDPLDSGFAYRFDQVVEALQRALEVDDYVIDRAWLPWQRPSRGAKAAPAPRYNDAYPGLVLFRCTSNDRSDIECKRRMLALLLVGETATAGIHRAAFDKALEIICECKGDKIEGNRIRVIGPFFSGSSTSLGMALKEARAKKDIDGKSLIPSIKVVCGSASGFDYERFARYYRNGSKTEEVFSSTMLPDNIVLKNLLKFLVDPNNPRIGVTDHPVVLLYEANTSFGQSIVEVKRGNELSRKSKQRFILVPYPLHISQLRATYTREQLERLETQGLPHGGRDLPFPMEASENPDGGREAIRAQSPLLTAAVNDLVLDNLTLALSNKRARYVCLISTDPQDTIFLARRIRDRHPDVQLLTLGGNLLYTHEDYSSALRGMIVGSTYPLAAPFQRWGDLTHENTSTRILFSDQFYQGCYNAVLVHLAEGYQRQIDQSQKKGCQPGEEPKKSPEETAQSELYHAMLDYGWKEGNKKTLPRIWISVVGSNGELVPIRNDPVDSENEDEIKAIFHRPIERGDQEGPLFGTMLYPSTFVIFFVILVAGNILVLRVTWKYLRESRWTDKIQDQCCRYKQRIDFGVMCLAQILLYGKLSYLAWTQRWGPVYHQSIGHWIIGLLIWLASLSMMMVAWCLLVAAFRPRVLSSLLLAGAALLLLWGFFRGTRARRTTLLVLILFIGIWLLAHFVFPEHEALVRNSLFFGIVPSTILLVIVCNILSSQLKGYDKVTRQTKSIFQAHAGDRLLFRAGFWLANADALVLSLATFALLIFAWRVVFYSFKPQDVIDFERMVHLSNGLSPLLPLFFFYAALYGWGAFLVKKLYLANHYAIRRPLPRTGSPSFKGLKSLHQEVLSELMPPSTFQKHFFWCLGALGLAVMIFFKVHDDYIPPLDGKAFGSWMLAGFAVGVFLLLFTLLQFHFAWNALRKMLRFLALVPMQGTFEHLSIKVVSIFGHYLFSQRPRHSQLALSVQQSHRLYRLFPAFRRELERAALYMGPQGDLDQATLNAAWQEVKLLFPKSRLGSPIPQDYENELDPVGEEDKVPPPTSPVTEWGGLTGEDVHQLARRCARILRHFWPAYRMEDTFGSSTTSSGFPASWPTPSFLSLPEDDPIRLWLLAAQEFVAMEVIRYLSQFIVQLRNLLSSLTVGSFLLLLAAAVYPFFPQQQLLLMLTTLGGVTAWFIITFLIQLNRDELISRITRSTPNRFTPDLTFLQGIATYVLPIVAGLMIQFPFFTSTLRSLFDPLFHILR